MKEINTMDNLNCKMQAHAGMGEENILEIEKNFMMSIEIILW